MTTGKTGSLFRRAAAVIFAAGVLGWAATAEAHVTLLTPTSGDMLVPGEDVTIGWSVIEHDTKGYDIDLAPDASADSVAVVHGLSPDQRSYDWTVPSLSCAQCVLTVTQRNTVVTDYSDSVTISIGSSSPPAAAAHDGGGCRVAGTDSTERSRDRDWWVCLAAVGVPVTLWRRARGAKRA